MITHGRAWDSCRLGTTAMCLGMNRYLWLYGSNAAGMPLTGIMCKMVGTGVKTSGAVCVTGQVTMSVYNAEGRSPAPVFPDRKGQL
eukprot:259559-Amphidinium_carterae.1